MKQQNEMPLNTPAPETANPSIHEQKEGGENNALLQLVEAELLGTPQRPGIIPEIDRLANPEQLKQILNRLGSLVSRCELLFLAGEVKAAQTGIRGFRFAYTHLQKRHQALKDEGTSLPDVALNKYLTSATVLEKVFEICANEPTAHVLTKVVDHFSESDFTRLQSPPFTDLFRHMGHFALKIHLRHFLIKQHLTHLQNDEGDFVIETNNTIKAVFSAYETTLFPTLAWDEATRERLTQEYVALAGTLDEITLDRAGGLVDTVMTMQKASKSAADRDNLSPAYTQYIETLAQFDQRWINLELEFSRVPRILKP